MPVFPHFFLGAPEGPSFFEQPPFFFGTFFVGFGLRGVFLRGFGPFFLGFPWLGRPCLGAFHFYPFVPQAPAPWLWRSWA